MKDYFSLVVQVDEEKGLIIIHVECDKERFSPIMKAMLSGLQTLRSSIIEETGEQLAKSKSEASQ